jgi:hypothetical protein
MTRYAKRKLKYSLNENFNLLPYVEWDRFATLTGAQALSDCVNNYVGGLLHDYQHYLSYTRTASLIGI